MEERILGYDVREMWYKEPYDFRMGSKLVKMLTADMWSSILDYGSYPDVVGNDREELGLGMIELPPIVPRFGTSYPVWSNLADLLNYLSPYQCAEGKPYWVVAITLRTVDLEREPQYRTREDWPRDPKANPDSVQSDWVLVGYDLGSEWSLSRITQHLVSEEAEAQDVSELTRELNRYGLFPTIEKAGEFGMLWDTAFPEDAPHVVYGIWRIEETRYRPR